ncbi:MAG: aminoglycoside adenylyltransferase domain-containing protein, partial [Ktedonobacteraceae bacterium]
VMGVCYTIGNIRRRFLLTLAFSHNPTPYEDVNAILHVLATKVRAILDSQFVGLYLYGSLSLGDFDPASSDVDFLVVTEDTLPEKMLEQLCEMHATIAASGMRYAHYLEGSYIPRQALWCYDPSNALHPTIGVDWPFQVALHGCDWIIQRHIVREHGVVVGGPAPATLLAPVLSQELQAAVRTIIQDDWQSRIEDVAWLSPRNYQAFAILTCCRIHHTLQCGRVSSKLQAAMWAQTMYPQWKPSIEKALMWRSQYEKDDVTETQIFLREALRLALEL